MTVNTYTRELTLTTMRLRFFTDFTNGKNDTISEYTSKLAKLVSGLSELEDHVAGNAEEALVKDKAAQLTWDFESTRYGMESVSAFLYKNKIGDMKLDQQYLENLELKLKGILHQYNMLCFRAFNLRKTLEEKYDYLSFRLPDSSEKLVESYMVNNPTPPQKEQDMYARVAENCVAEEHEYSRRNRETITPYAKDVKTYFQLLVFIEITDNYWSDDEFYFDLINKPITNYFAYFAVKSFVLSFCTLT